MAELNGAPASADDLQALALTNYGHFTSMRVDDHRVRGLTMHMERLVRDCQFVFGVELDTDQVREYVRHAVGEDEGSFVTRVTIFDPGLEMGRPGADATPHVLVTKRPAGSLPPPPMQAKTFLFSRDSAPVKHLGLFSQLRLRREAQLNGFDDAIFVEPDGHISEGGTWNLGFVDAAGAVVWPKASVLPGVTMQLLQDAHESTTAPVTHEDLPQMRAAFATNTTIGVRTITTIDNLAFPADDPVLTRLQQLYVGIEGEPL